MNIKNKVKYLKRNVPIGEILEPIYKGDPYIKFEKILTRKYPHSAILNNMIGNTNIDHKGISLIEKFIDQNNKDIDLSIDIKIQKKITCHHGEKFISIEPSKLSLDISFKLKYEDCLIGNQENKVNVYEDNLEDIFNSRTFCLFDDVEKIKEKGLAKGGSLDNAIVVKGNEILNSEKLRNPKEFVNHKILDCIGDLYTSGYRIIGSVNCSQGGHFLTNQLLKKVFENKENFSIIEIQERNLPHTILNKTLLRSIA